MAGTLQSLPAVTGGVTRVLIADPDADVRRSLGEAFGSAGYKVTTVRDGSRALEAAVLNHPDIVLFEERNSLVDARKFVEILRSNPRTEQIPVVMMSHKGPEDWPMLGYRESHIQKPFRADAVLSHVAAVLKKVDAARDLQDAAREIQGNLRQFPLADLLQIMSMNKRSGLLTLSGAEGGGRIFLKDGRAVDAECGAVSGEKAVYRIMRREDGHFAFFPDRVSPHLRIFKPVDNLIMEAAHQKDEWERLQGTLPPAQTRFLLGVLLDSMLEEMPPAAKELATLLKGGGRTLGELLDASKAADHEVAEALVTMLDMGVAVAEAPDSVRAETEEGRGPLLLPPEQLAALRTCLRRAYPDREHDPASTAKVLLISPDLELLSSSVEAMNDIPSLRPASHRQVARGLGTLAQLSLGEGVALDLFAVPVQRSAMPMWRAFMVGCLGGILLLPRGGSSREESQLLHALWTFVTLELGLPLVLAAPAVAGGAAPADLLESHGLPRSEPLIEMNLQGSEGVREVLGAVIERVARNA